jgi:CRP/FNR family transcriptional regulator, cyclic AMP receptor protein
MIALKKTKETDFDIEAYLNSAGAGRRMIEVRRDQPFFSQGDPADCVFYLHKGRIKITVVSSGGKEATIRLVGTNDFFGEKAMEASPGLA